MKHFWVLLFSFLLIACKSHSSNTVQLAQNGKSEYEIYISPQANNFLKDAVKDLQKYFYKISGVRLPVTNEKQSQHQIVIGDDAFVKGLDVDIPFDQIKPDGFIIKTSGTNLFISGISEQGVINGIYTFLEKYLGCRYYAENAIVIPEKDSIILDDINDLQNPAFQMRILNSNKGFNATYRKWHKLYAPPSKNDAWLKYGWWVHNVLKYVRPSRYYNDHPEYFMLRNGNRIKKDICYTNDDVFNLIKADIANQLQQEPYIEYVGVSQPDNAGGVCEHTKCAQVKRQHGGVNSAVVMYLVNKVANEFPDKTIHTLAYQHTRTPPTNIVVEDNVLIFVTNTTPNRERATSVDPSVNNFIKDLRGWQDLTDNIIVWDYMANFKYPFMPYPNLFLMQKAFRNYKDLGIKKLFIQSTTGKSIGLQGLKSYIASKLMWNPYVNLDHVMNDYLTNYYGDAGPYIREYIDLMTGELSTGGLDLNRVRDPLDYDNSYLAPRLLEEYTHIFEKAREAVQQNEKLLTRVDKAQQPLRYARISIYREMLNKKNNAEKKLNISITEYNNLVKEFVKKTKKYNIKKIGRGVKSPDTFLRLNSIENN